MDPMSIFVIEILRFSFGLGYFINFTKEFIFIKEDSFVLIFNIFYMFYFNMSKYYNF